jgi:hypothetical protein
LRRPGLQASIFFAGAFIHEPPCQFPLFVVERPGTGYEEPLRLEAVSCGTLTETWSPRLVHPGASPSCEQLNVRTLAQRFDVIEYGGFLGMPAGDGFEGGPDGLRAHLALASRPNQTHFMFHPHRPTHPEPPLPGRRLFQPDDFTFQREVPGRHHIEGLLLHRGDTPEEQRAVIGAAAGERRRAPPPRGSHSASPHHDQDPVTVAE